MRRQPLRLAILEATQILEGAGIESPRADAELLAAHVLGVDRGELPMVPLVDPQAVDALGQFVTQRAKRVPLQHITGWAAIGDITVEVGPGVFVPRPETDLLLEWGTQLLKSRSNPVVVDLCTGSGALALALAHARPDAQVYAIDNDPTALAWARRNAEARVSAGGSPIRLYSGDITDTRLFAELDGLVDLVMCNPPYVPMGKELPPEVAEHDPAHAVYAGEGGLALIKSAVSMAARLLRPSGGVAIEHDDEHGQAVAEMLAARRVLTGVDRQADLAGRPRFATARRAE